MTQRNPMNERYTTDTVKGKTRKSAASAKPRSKAASSVREAAPKSKKEKAKEQKAKAKERAERSGMAESAETIARQKELKKWRTIWIVLLATSIVLTTVSIFLTFQPDFSDSPASMIVIMVAFAFLLLAYYLNSAKVTPLRTEQLVAERGKSKKARAEQKRARAEKRERDKESEKETAQEGK